MSTLHKLGLALVLLAAAGAANAQSDIILDNTSAAFSTIGTWPTSTSTAGYYGTNYQTHAANGIPPAAIAVDNTDPGFSVTGSWPTSTSVSGYYGSNYQVHAANGVPPTAIAEDNAGGSTVGTWPTSTSVGGYYGTNYQDHAAGTGANTFTWSLNVATAGTYDVYARWTAYSNRASNAKYTINHSGGSDVVTVDQRANGATWQLLGTYSFDAGAATISLSDDADGYVIADAVMLQPPGAAPNTATWSMDVPAAGTYNVYARWTAYPNRATNAKFTVNSASGPSTVTVNQQDGAGGQWNLLGTYSFNAGTASVSLTDQADGYVIADAVMLLPPGSPPNSAVWTPNVPQAGQYQVYAWWSAYSNRATNATYTVTNSQGSTPVTVNQQANGGTWNLLGTFALSPGTADTVALTDQANGYVIADAIRLVPVQVQAQAKLYFIEPDHLNTPRVVEDSAQKVVWRWDQSEPFGDSPPNEDPDGDSVAFSFPLRFPGQVSDRETTLSNNYFRDYDSRIGRYVESDPLGIRAGYNTYGYVQGSPLRWSDLFGLQVTFTCRPLSALPAFTGVRHCSVFVWHWKIVCGKKKKVIDAQFSLPGFEEKPTTDPNNSTYKNDRDAFSHPGDGNANYEIPPPNGESQSAFDKAVTASGNTYSQGPYDPFFGPNSNTAATQIIEGAGGTVPDVPGAVAQWAPRTWGPQW